MVEVIKRKALYKIFDEEGDTLARYLTTSPRDALETYARKAGLPAGPIVNNSMELEALGRVFAKRALPE
jgi:hypothetical protein